MVGGVRRSHWKALATRVVYQLATAWFKHAGIFPLSRRLSPNHGVPMVDDNHTLKSSPFFDGKPRKPKRERDAS